MIGSEERYSRIHFFCLILNQVISKYSSNDCTILLDDCKDLSNGKIGFDFELV